MLSPLDTLGQTPLAALLGLQRNHWHAEYARYCAEAKELGRPPPLPDVNSQHLAICQHLHSEIDELVRCANWKVHQQTKPASKATATLEMVDVFKFLLTLMAIHDISADAFVAAFMDKSRVVARRVAVERMRHAATCGRLPPLLVCDLDGVVCARDTALLAFIHAQTRTAYDSTGAVKAAVGQHGYERLKDAFYEAGGFKTAMVVEAAANSLRYAKAKDVTILIVTARDIKRFPTIEVDTYRWLDDNNIPADAVLFAAEKERAIAGLVPRLSIAIDDEEQNVVRLRYVCRAERYYMNDVLDTAIDDLVRLNHAG